MANYRVNNNVQPNGDHEVHKEGCIYYNLTNYEYLGNHDTCSSAVRKAKTIHAKADGCKTCIPTCHNT